MVTFNRNCGNRRLAFFGFLIAFVTIIPFGLLEAKVRKADRQSVAFLKRSSSDKMLSTMQSITGRLLLDDAGCLFVNSNDEQFVIIWPSSAVLKRKPSISVWSNGRQYRLGSSISLTGSGSGPIQMDEIDKVKVPSGCKGRLAFIVSG